MESLYSQHVSYVEDLQEGSSVCKSADLEELKQRRPRNIFDLSPGAIVGRVHFKCRECDTQGLVLVLVHATCTGKRLNLPKLLLQGNHPSLELSL